MDYYLIHQTTLKGLEGILKDGALLPTGKTDFSLDELNHAAGLEEQDERIQREYQNKVFTSLLIPVKKVIEDYPKDEYTWWSDFGKSVFLIFDYKKIFKDCKVKKFYCKNWLYGEKIDNFCYDYNDLGISSPEKNIEKWIENSKGEFYKQLKNGFRFSNGMNILNEVVIEDGIPLSSGSSENLGNSSNLLYIYIHIPNQKNNALYEKYETEDFSLTKWVMKEVNLIEKLKNKYPQYEWRIELPEIPFYSKAEV